jgi:ParB family transcriptional regulator, chromosome partitioning protein
MQKTWPQSSSIIASGFFEVIDLSKLRQSQNVHRNLTNIQDLSASIMQKGLLQPILVRPMDSYFEIIAGNRRFMACKSLGWRKISCHIVECDDRNAFEIGLVENIQKDTISPIDEGMAFKAYISDFGWGGISDLSRRIGKSISYIAKRIKLLALPAEVLEALINKELSTSVAEELLSVKDEDEQSKLAALIINRHMSLRKTRNLLGLKNISTEIYADEIYNRHILIGERSFDKVISALRIAMNRISEIINDLEEDWILHEILMQHKNMLHTQIDILLKEKRKLQ